MGKNKLSYGTSNLTPKLTEQSSNKQIDSAINIWANIPNLN